MKKIRIAIAGVGNCASSLVQGIEHYRRLGARRGRAAPGLMHLEIGGYRPQDIEVVCAFDIDRRKVGQPLGKAIFAPPNCTMRLVDRIARGSTVVQMGRILDGIAAHMKEYPPERTFVPAKEEPVDVARALKRSGAEILVNYLPVGSTRAVQFYARCCLEAGVSLLNCIPVFIASDPGWARQFAARGIPVVGDDVKSQVGSTIVHRTLVKLFEDRGVRVERTYQLNTAGNTDFLNMLERRRLRDKKVSKTESVQSQLPERLPDENIHIGPSDYVPWQNDNKIGFVRVEGRGFAGAPIELELRLSVEDSPNSAGVVVDAIRCLALARERGIGGSLESVSAYLMKHPPRQHPDAEARELIEEFIAGKRRS